MTVPRVDEVDRIARLNDPIVRKQAEARAQQHTERMEAEFTDLGLQVETREESLTARELALSRHEGDLRTSIQNLQLIT